MNSSNLDWQLVMISTWPPHECGIATFASDLRTGLLKVEPSLVIKVVAVNPRGKSLAYGNEVIRSIAKDNLPDYIELSKYVNRLSGSTVVCVQHEFGIFGGQDGSYILKFLSLCNKPKVTILHNPLTSPLEGIWQDKRTNLLNQIIKKSEISVVFGEKIKTKLVKKGRVKKGKLRVIPHGIPEFMFKNKITPIKELGNVNLFPLIGSFGVLHVRKGYEFLIQSIDRLSKIFPNVGVVLAGAVRDSPRDQAYFGYLKDLTRRCGFAERVVFIPRFLTVSELKYLFKKIDIFITPYVMLEHGSSGTLTFALAGKKSIISTPYLYSQELLSRGRGVMIPFADSRSIYEVVSYLISNPKQKRQMENKAFEYAQKLKWTKIAEKYIDLFNNVSKE